MLAINLSEELYKYTLDSTLSGPFICTATSTPQRRWSRAFSDKVQVSSDNQWCVNFKYYCIFTTIQCILQEYVLSGHFSPNGFPYGLCRYSARLPQFRSSKRNRTIWPPWELNSRHSIQEYAINCLSSTTHHPPRMPPIRSAVDGKIWSSAMCARVLAWRKKSTK